jgi:hypothetical protein
MANKTDLNNILLIDESFIKAFSEFNEKLMIALETIADIQDGVKNNQKAITSVNQTVEILTESLAIFIEKLSETLIIMNNRLSVIEEQISIYKTLNDFDMSNNNPKAMN